MTHDNLADWSVTVVALPVAPGLSGHERTRPGQLASAFRDAGASVTLLSADENFESDSSGGISPKELRSKWVRRLLPFGAASGPSVATRGPIRRRWNLWSFQLIGAIAELMILRAAVKESRGEPSLIVFSDVRWMTSATVGLVVRRRAAVAVFQNSRPWPYGFSRFWTLLDRLPLVPSSWRQSLTVIHPVKPMLEEWRAAEPRARHVLLSPTGVPYYKWPSSRAEARAALGGLIPPQVAHLVLHFGNMREYKDLDVLLRAVPLLPSDSAFLLAGSSQGSPAGFTDSIAQLSRQFPDRLIIRDEFIPEADIPLLFAAADCVVVSHRPDKHSSDSGPAMAAVGAGTPVVANRSSLTGEQVAELGFGEVFDDGDEQSLISAVLAATMPERQESLALAFASVKEQRSMRAVAERTLGLATSPLPSGGPYV